MKVTQDGGKPIKIWADEIEPGAMEQAVNLSRLPFALKHVALMPDAHQGYGMPVGGVLFADKAIVPYAIGVDIGCGVALIETDLTLGSLGQGSVDMNESDADIVKRFLDQVARDVPVGNGPQAQHKEPQGESFFETEAWNAAAYHPSAHAALVMLNAEVQLGTLGGGNHFLELQADDDGRIWFMLHSGSRSVDKDIESVMAASAALVKPIRRHRPLGVVKG